MKAVGLEKYLPISDPSSLLDVELARPVPGPLDLLVEVQAVSVNPVDTKVRSPKAKVEEAPRVLGWDAAGTVVEVGAEVKGFAVGDAVYYAGDITRPGSNAELQAVDSRIVGHAPKSLSPAQSAAIPLTALTAWEALFDRLRISAEGGHRGRSILLVGGAGGVGSIAIQLAKWAQLRVIATASRAESTKWVRELGADEVIDHREPLDAGLAKVTAGGQVDYILCMNSTAQHWDAMCRGIAPQGLIASIVEVSEPVNIGQLMGKSAGFVWELMFTRSMHGTADIAAQGEILERVATLLDQGTLRGTAKRVLSPICASTLREAHALLEAGHVVGKVVVEGWR